MTTEASRAHAFALPDGTSWLGILAKRTYRILPGRRATASGSPAPICEDIEYVDSANPGASPRLVQDLDLVAFARPFTDVIVRGSAHAGPRGASYVDTGVAVGDARKAVRVWGDRRLTLGARGHIVFGDPEPFVDRALTWDDAYGGCSAPCNAQEDTGTWRRVEPPAPIEYPRNPSGRGFALAVDRERLEGTLAPSLEDPADPVTPERMLAASASDWRERPTAACYEPVDWLMHPRAGYLPWVNDLEPGAQHDAPQLLERLFGHGVQLDLRIYNCAPSGLASCRLYGHERVSLWRLHHQHALYEFDLPSDPPRMLVEPPGCGLRELTPMLQGVLIEPERERITLTWTGALQTAARFPDELVASLRHTISWRSAS